MDRFSKGSLVYFSEINVKSLMAVIISYVLIHKIELYLKTRACNNGNLNE